jgi:4-cresol dehydrogenase (hydroxylating)
LYGLLKGQPTAVPVNSTYWRKRTPPPANGDPDRDRCGLLWCSHTAPTMGAHAERMMEITERVALHYGFEPIVSITLLTERTICSVLSLSYDRDVEGEDQRALECYRELMHELSAAGYPPYRLGVQSAYALPGESGYQDFVKGIKKQLDPHGV